MTRRTGWPKIFHYRRISDDKLSTVPFGRDQSFTFEVHDHEAFQRLIHTGKLNQERHTGPKAEIIDNRVSGALRESYQRDDPNVPLA